LSLIHLHHMEPVDCFLYEILSKSLDFSDQNVQFLCRSEDAILAFLFSSDRTELEFPPLNSYFRRIIHRLGRRYNLAHRVETTNLFNVDSTRRKIYLTKPVSLDQDTFFSALPLLKCVDWIPERVQSIQLCVLSTLLQSNDNDNLLLTNTSSTNSSSTNLSSTSSLSTPLPSSTTTTKPKFKILKRIIESVPETLNGNASSPSNNQIISIEEREAKYQEARDRIFQGFVESEATNEIPPIAPSTVVPTQLNPEAQPFFIPQHQLQETEEIEKVVDVVVVVVEEEQEFPHITINHIYTIKPINPDCLLSKEDFMQILSLEKSNSKSPAIIKTRQLPSNFAFILHNSNGTTLKSSDKWTIEKWSPKIIFD
jgi:hypothetical protein